VNAAHVWKLPDSGRIEEGGYADIVISKKKQNESQPESFFSLNPEDILLIIQKGEIRLYDQILEIQINEENKSGHAFSRVRINESTKYIQGDLRGLIKEIYQHCPGIKLPVSI
jgi:homogentisate 1,2-dioxygenase